MSNATKIQGWLESGYTSYSRTRLLQVGDAALAKWGKEIRAACEGTNIPPELVAIRIGHETGGNPRAVSSNDERGLMQWGPWHDWGSRWGVGKANAFDPAISVLGGVRYWDSVDRQIMVWAEKNLDVIPTELDRWALLWAWLSNGGGALQQMLSKLKLEGKKLQEPLHENALRAMQTDAGAAVMFERAKAGYFGLAVYQPNTDKIVQTVSKRMAKARAAAEAAAAMRGDDVSYTTSFLVGGALATVLLLAVVYVPRIAASL